MAGRFSKMCIRDSYYLVGALLGRFGWAEVPLPGGCDLGGRPIDQHIKGFVSMGADVDVRNGLICAKVASGRLAGGQVYLDMVSVGATMNIMLAGVLAEGMTIIENAAKEPHIVDLANFLNSMGANIMGAGTDVIKIRGVKQLRGGAYSIIPDQIEAGTYMAAVAAAGGDVLIQNAVSYTHLDVYKRQFLGCLTTSPMIFRVTSSKWSIWAEMVSSSMLSLRRRISDTARSRSWISLSSSGSPVVSCFFFSCLGFSGSFDCSPGI